MPKKNIILTICLLAVSLSAQSREVDNYVALKNIPQQFVSLRALGMGNAFTAIADDATGLMYNPAALARRTSGVFRGSLSGGFSGDFFDFIGDVADATNSGGTETDQLNAMLDVFNKNFGKVFHSRIPRIYGAYARPHWGIVFAPMDVTNNMTINRAAGAPAIALNLTQDTTIAFGYGMDVNWFKDWFGWNGRLSVGATGKLIHRIFVGQTIMANTLITGSGDIFDTNDAAEGLTVDADLGIMFTPKIPESGWLKTFKAAKPTFAVVLRNALDTGFSTSLKVISETSKQAPSMGRRLDLGSEWDLPDFWVFDPHLAIDMKDILHENWSLKKGVHIGAELYWKMFSWWKGTWTMGLNQGYPTFGIGARFAWFNLDLVSYAEEMGTSDDPIENRRYMMEMSLEF